MGDGGTMKVRRSMPGKLALTAALFVFSALAVAEGPSDN
jgi:hypothetical protein